MSREELIESICPYHDESCVGDRKCESCDAELNELLDKYDKEVIKKFAEWFAEVSKVSEPIKEHTINRWIEDFNKW